MEIYEVDWIGCCGGRYCNINGKEVMHDELLDIVFEDKKVVGIKYKKRTQYYDMFVYQHGGRSICSISRKEAFKKEKEYKRIKLIEKLAGV